MQSTEEFVELLEERLSQLEHRLGRAHSRSRVTAAAVAAVAVIASVVLRHDVTAVWSVWVCAVAGYHAGSRTVRTERS